MASESSTQSRLPPPMLPQSPQQSVPLQQPYPHQQQEVGFGPYPATYNQPVQPYYQLHQPMPYTEQEQQKKSLVPEPKGWKWTKVALHLLALVLSIIGSSLALSHINFNSDIYYTPNFDRIVCGSPLGVAVIWSAAEIITLACRRFVAGIHPGAHVGLSLLLWLGCATAVGVVIDSSHYRKRSYIDTAVIAIIVAVIHLALFIGACVDTAKRNSLANRPVMPAHGPPYMLPGWQPMPQPQPQSQQQWPQGEQHENGSNEMRNATLMMLEAPAGHNRVGRHEVPLQKTYRAVWELGPGIPKQSHSPPPEFSKVAAD